MAASSVTLAEVFRPWHFAGLSHLWPDPNAVDLDPETLALLERLTQPGRRPITPAIRPPAPPAQPGDVSGTGRHLAPAGAASSPESKRTAPHLGRRSASPIQSTVPTVAATEFLSAARQELLRHTPAAPLLWTYPELGPDLVGRGAPRRSACLRALIGGLSLPKGTSCFWPPALPDEGSEAPAQFLSGVALLRPKAIILFGAECLPMCGLPPVLNAPYTDAIITGRLALLLPSMVELSSLDSLPPACMDFLAASFAGFPGLLAR